MLNVAIGAGSGGGAPRPSGSRAPTPQPNPAPGPTARAVVSPATAIPSTDFSRSTLSLPFSEGAVVVVTLRFPALPLSPPFASARILPRPADPLTPVPALFFLLFALMVTWDKTLLFAPIACQPQPSFLKYLRLLARRCYPTCVTFSPRCPNVLLQGATLCVVSNTDSC